MKKRKEWSVYHHDFGCYFDNLWYLISDICFYVHQRHFELPPETSFFYRWFYLKSHFSILAQYHKIIVKYQINELVHRILDNLDKETIFLSFTIINIYDRYELNFLSFSKVIFHQVCCIIQFKKLYELYFLMKTKHLVKLDYFFHWLI